MSTPISGAGGAIPPSGRPIVPTNRRWANIWPMCPGDAHLHVAAIHPPFGRRFIGGPHDITPLNLAQHVPLREDPGGDVDFILEPVDERLIPLLQQLYPAGQYETHRDRFDRTLFLTYRVPRARLRCRARLAGRISTRHDGGDAAA